MGVHRHPHWILTAATQEQYDLLFKAPNWRDFWKPSFEVPNVDAMVDEVAGEYQESQRSDKEAPSEPPDEPPDEPFDEGPCSPGSGPAQ